MNRAFACTARRIESLASPTDTVAVKCAIQALMVRMDVVGQTRMHMLTRRRSVGRVEAEADLFSLAARDSMGLDPEVRFMHVSREVCL